MKDVRIAERPIGPGHGVYVIAEIGFNHGGDLVLAKKMIEAAAGAGADAVKFQTFKAAALVLESSEHFDVIKNAELSLEDHRQLARAAAAAGVHFLSTAFDEDSLDLLERVGVPAYKVASMDLDNLPFLERLAGLGKPILLSTGMATEEEIGEAVETIRACGNDRIIVLHCVSEYPTPLEDANLLTIPRLGEAFGLPTGYSDHVLGNAAAVAAAALGASVIEKHFTSDKSLPGPDHALSADPEEMAALVKTVREVETALGRPVADEDRPDRANAVAFRRGLHAAVDIPEGTVITKGMLKCVRPGGGLGPKDIGRILGRETKQDIAKEAPIPPEAV
jgi:N-acetylneuraminate synthase/N,N'-diacetyllegionaminate synthase